MLVQHTCVLLYASISPGLEQVCSCCQYYHQARLLAPLLDGQYSCPDLLLGLLWQGRSRASRVRCPRPLLCSTVTM